MTMVLGTPTVVYGRGRCRITTHNTDGSPLWRYTLDAVAPEGLAVVFTPEGVMHQLGSGAGWQRKFGLRGFRPSISLKWDAGLQAKLEQMIYPAGGDPPPHWVRWGDVEMAEGLSQIISASSLVRCLVEPHMDKGWSFYAQPDPGKAFQINDYKLVVHRGLTLQLIGTDLIPSIPDWSNL